MHMKTKTSTYLARFFRLGFLALALAVVVPTADCVAQPVLLLDPAFQAPQRPGVPFDHDRHAEDLDCTLCHHSYENGQNIWEHDMQTRCSACHEAGDRGRLGLRQAWHGQCVGCHEQSPKAPVTCGECHVRGQERQPR
ncbi:MAG: cytochrome c family protein [Desulfomicrobium sp.]|nr:cytochrome c family protein [Pseudomonadota bacterium]MBU4571442.1 cytochrome c family protein [Pseudomonadota bacterium]MBU4594430.1 cytochrome c family protein [Pseudomonadota bacterium]MBV1720249.1 cytochrome c family protein [Desulfomicrobium sp.]MBV1747435.1 cytochrome c family protein [Desulfomicrobium sp.]